MRFFVHKFISDERNQKSALDNFQAPIPGGGGGHFIAGDI
ncbi:hypothetical protein B6N60_02165 [Richelia sinica FACHB-800]|uniref:Uncharacterized protein n=1 Tax=Richelia sinica FACHB-800 TaxID=1357546 RepID=A0A975Y4S2_9NOST|nr:hypothetical protein B6N60_02165 [Richelia sinica FACHB-800]